MCTQTHTAKVACINSVSRYRSSCTSLFLCLEVCASDLLCVGLALFFPPSLKTLTCANTYMHRVTSQFSFASQLPMGLPPTYMQPHTHARTHTHTHTHTHLFSQLHSELTPGLALSQNHKASCTRRQVSVSSGSVCVCVRARVWLMIHGITVVVVVEWCLACVCALQPH